MISKKAVDAFLARNLEEWDWLKNESKEDLVDVVYDRAPGIKFSKPTPWKHQWACYYIGLELDDFVFLLDAGTGKSRILLDLFAIKRAIGKANKALIVLERNTNLYDFADQIKEHRPELEACVLDGSSIEKEASLRDSDADIFLITYMGLVAMVGMGKTGAKKKTPKVNKALIKDLFGHIDFLGVDECQNISNHDTQSYLACNEIAKSAVCRYGATATPFGRDPQKLWAQFNVVDQGETFGPTLGIFRQAFFNAQQKPFGGIEYTLSNKRKPQLYRTLKHRSIRYMEEECQDLPKRVPPRLHHIGLPKGAEPYYKKVVKQFREAHGDYQAQENAFLRMRQICSGYMGLVRKEENEEGAMVVVDKLDFEFANNPKVEELIYQLENTREDRKVIIFHEFNTSGEIIAREMKKAGFDKSVSINGRRKRQDNRDALDAFKHDPDIKHAIINVFSGSTGLNLQMANHTHFFESPVSPIKRYQAEKRTRRGGQKLKCFYNDYIVKGGVEEDILGYLQEGKDLWEEILEGKIKSFKGK